MLESLRAPLTVSPPATARIRSLACECSWSWPCDPATQRFNVFGDVGKRLAALLKQLGRGVISDDPWARLISRRIRR